jgi:hypothetical protein
VLRHAKELLVLSRQEAIGLVDYFCQIAHKQEDKEAGTATRMMAVNA